MAVVQLGAAAAGFGALLAVPVGVPAALIGAGLADGSAYLRELRGVLRAASYEASGERADIGAVAGQADAAGHHVHVLLLQAGRGAVLAGGHAGVEGVLLTLDVLVHGGGAAVTKGPAKVPVGGAPTHDDSCCNE